jgi:hypothetical protein
MYQRGIQWCLHSQLGRNDEAYVDEVVVKNREDEGLISNLAETFENLRKFKMELNPKKCIFSVPVEKLLWYMVSRRGINHTREGVGYQKIKPHESLHDVKKLMGCITVLSRFISRLSIMGLCF